MYTRFCATLVFTQHIHLYVRRHNYSFMLSGKPTYINFFFPFPSPFSVRNHAGSLRVCVCICAELFVDFKHVHIFT